MNKRVNAVTEAILGETRIGSLVRDGNGHMRIYAGHFQWLKCDGRQFDVEYHDELAQLLGCHWSSYGRTPRLL